MKSSGVSLLFNVMQRVKCPSGNANEFGMHYCNLVKYYLDFIVIGSKTVDFPKLILIESLAIDQLIRNQDK